MDKQYYIDTFVVKREDGHAIRLARHDDAEDYYAQNYDPLDKEVARATGSKERFTKNEVVSFFSLSVDAPDRYHFLIISPDGSIIGESVINEIDYTVGSANFRIGIFHSDEHGKGIGTWAVKVVRDFAFEKLKLHRLSLDVFSFNERAQKVYAKSGFKVEGVLRDAVRDGDLYADDILMAILEDEWSEIKSKEALK